jgi:hypothetical protein
LVALAAAVPTPGAGFDFIAEMKLAALDGGSLHIGAADGPPATLLPLPYALPHDGEA